MALAFAIAKICTGRDDDDTNVAEPGCCTEVVGV